MAEYQYDLVVIGAGPAGESAAMNGTKAGLRVAVVDERSTVGGNCTHQGTIPSKALRHAVHQVMQFNRNPMFRHMSGQKWLSFPQVLETADRVINKQVAMRARFYARNRVDLFHGHATFKDNNSLQLQLDDNKVDVLKAKDFVIATGSRPYQPPEIDFDHPRIFDSDSILTLTTTPRNIAIFGAGVIGCEYASIFNGLGSKVDLINPGERLLAFMDDEISDALSYHLRGHGVLIRHNESFKSVEGFDDHVVLTLESGKRVKCEAFMWANGRTGNTDSLNLEAVDLEPNSRGQLAVDDHYRTKQANIFAAGDVIGWPSLASAAYDQGRSISGVISNNGTYRHVNDIPTGIYTIPEISSIGKTERELTVAKVPYEVGKAYFKDTARAQITGEEAGVLKLLFHRDTTELLGIHCFGDQAAEILHIGQAIMSQPNGGNSIRYFLEHTFNYPTMAEAYRVAALNGINRLF
ncbi:Si-specific NAD(P)(+) transhydrogenase [Reinekea marinisedimentorum]|uniref:Soluble pyridine nucleotide transhydrogenase n=1 Tax=Reinekea marinisedimentorum TaxID=230495 RepID=A0A4R3ID93_9GAMM|nr:Si-specific NAD(P)(+) transhydrogenase [Reinekea marinisedimentorum]TCS42625.1 NAD(P) transhydrogenase [Reinekea marinisedimentorum]